MPSTVKIERRSLGQQVASVIRDMILRGEIKPGQRLVEERLARRVGTSRTPVREALLSLERENLVARRLRGGYWVRPMTTKEVEEVTGVRAALESFAVESAADTLSHELLKDLKTNVAKFDDALAQGDGRKLVELNTAFHEMLYTASSNQLLHRLLNELSDVIQRFRRELLSDEASAARSLADHRRMLEALEAGNAQEAAKACREHVLAGGRWIMDKLNRPEREGE